MRHRTLIRPVLSLVLLTLGLAVSLRAQAPATPPDFGLIGWATEAGGTTGGAGGPTVTVTTARDFVAAVQAPGAATVLVSGVMDLAGGVVKPASDKSIIGLGAGAGVVGTIALVDVHNIIIRNLHITTPPGAASRDGMSTTRAHHIWIDHCSFGQCTDGQLDITHGSDYITVSWCRFAYTDPKIGHRFTMLIGNADRRAATDRGRLKVTLHHNWWGTLADQRMPRVRYGQVHIFNNHYAASGNSYCIGLGCSSQVLVESNSFEGVADLWRDMAGAGGFSDPACEPGRIQWNEDNFLVDATLPTWAPNSQVFAPPYAYKLDAGAAVKAIVTQHAGAGRGPFAQ